jgi:hypothetical protein
MCLFNLINIIPYPNKKFSSVFMFGIISWGFLYSLFLNVFSDWLTLVFIIFALDLFSVYWLTYRNNNNDSTESQEQLDNLPEFTEANDDVITEDFSEETTSTNEKT